MLPMSLAALVDREPSERFWKLVGQEATGAPGLAHQRASQWAVTLEDLQEQDLAQGLGVVAHQAGFIKEMAEAALIT